MITIRDIKDRFPILYECDYKWKDSEKYRDLNKLLYELGYELLDKTIAGDYNDIKAYFSCEIKRIGDKTDYKKAYEILMEFWDCIPDRQKQDVHVKLKECGL